MQIQPHIHPAWCFFRSDEVILDNRGERITLLHTAPASAYGVFGFKLLKFYVKIMASEKYILSDRSV